MLQTVKKLYLRALDKHKAADVAGKQSELPKLYLFTEAQEEIDVLFDSDDMMDEGLYAICFPCCVC